MIDIWKAQKNVLDSLTNDLKPSLKIIYITSLTHINY